MFTPSRLLSTTLPWLALALSIGRAAAQQDPGRQGIDFFENKIRPVLVERCYKCHSAESKKNKGGLRLDGRDHLLKGGRSGSAVVLSDPEKSLLIQAIRGGLDELKMPPGEDPLTPAQIHDFAAWVKMGVPFPGSAGGASQPVKPSIDLVEARKFWSLQPIKNPALPKVQTSAWPHDSIDRFILARLEEKGMKPAPAADKRTLLRRATYSLTGLPPSSEDLDAFLADSSPNAYARAVDRLLDSPQYGAHWGRHWLDIARYGDTKWVGAGEDRRLPFAYTYRDWVIQALNEDMPYDRFVTLQLAADQIQGGRQSDQAALGFLTVGRWFTGNLHDVIDDQIDVVTRGLLGMTVQCARCHDHKYDPISAKDYYSLYGLFAAARMPVEGNGILAELPEIAPAPVDAAVAQELSLLRDRLDKFLLVRLTKVRDEFRTPEKLVDYLLAAESVVKKTDNDVRALAKATGLKEQILFRWVRFLQRTLKGTQPIFGPWHAFAQLSEAEFSTKAGMLAEQEMSNKMVNRKVAAILSPTPASLPELARRYAQLLTKFDVDEASSDTEQEMLRQVLRSNDSPVQVPLNELGNFMSRDEKDQTLQMRREMLARLCSLSERADQYLAFQHEAAPILAEVKEFLHKRRSAVAAEIRSPEKIADYLLAARDADGADEAKLRSIVNGRKLSERLLGRWIAYLRKNAERNDSVFQAWRAFAVLSDKDFADKLPRTITGNKIVAQAFDTPPATLKEVAKRYGELIAKFSKPTPVVPVDEEALRQVSAARESPLAFEPEEVFDYFTRKDVDELRNKENKLVRLYLDSPGAGPRAMALRDSPRDYAQKVFVRGNPNVHGEDASGRFLAVLSSDDRSAFTKGKGRLDLAQAIVDPANPLTPRVIVNRVWQWHFGTGLIRTSSDLGIRGTEPSHPELLDFLARQFMAEGWSLKKLHRHILLSATFQQSSQDNPAYRTADPENRLLWRMSRRRLSFEELRDTLLATAGRLDATVGGKSMDLAKSTSRRRTIYGTVDRITLPGFYRYFDFPSADAHISERHETITPQQALYMMNNSFVMDQAVYLSRRTEATGAKSAERITSLYKLVYGRSPGKEELALGLEFVEASTTVDEAPPASPWRYGWGSYSEKLGRVVEFEPFAFFGNNQWKGGPQEIDPLLGRSYVNQHGGHAGRDSSRAVIRRWIAPLDGKLSISGALSCQPGAVQPSGDGVRGRIVSSRHGQLKAWLVHGTEEPTDLAGVEVKRGDTIDFVVDARGRDNFAGFTWAPVLRTEGPDSAKNPKLLWDAAKDFPSKAPPATGPRAFGTWDRYAQVLLESNEFLFLD